MNRVSVAVVLVVLFLRSCCRTCWLSARRRLWTLLLGALLLRLRALCGLRALRRLRTLGRLRTLRRLRALGRLWPLLSRLRTLLLWTRDRRACCRLRLRSGSRGRRSTLRLRPRGVVSPRGVIGHGRTYRSLLCRTIRWPTRRLRGVAYLITASARWQAVARSRCSSGRNVRLRGSRG